jgi:hypothetical protein
MWEKPYISIFVEIGALRNDLKMAIAAIMVAILAAIFNMVAKTHKQFRSAPMRV